MEQTGANRTQTFKQKCHDTHIQTDSGPNWGLQFTALCDVMLCSLVSTAWDSRRPELTLVKTMSQCSAGRIPAAGYTGCQATRHIWRHLQNSSNNMSVALWPPRVYSGAGSTVPGRSALPLLPTVSSPLTYAVPLGVCRQQLRKFWTSALDNREWSASRSDRFTPKQGSSLTVPEPVRIRCSGEKSFSPPHEGTFWRGRYAISRVKKAAVSSSSRAEKSTKKLCCRGSCCLPLQGIRRYPIMRRTYKPNFTQIVRKMSLSSLQQTCSCLHRLSLSSLQQTCSCLHRLSLSSLQQTCSYLHRLSLSSLQQTCSSLHKLSLSSLPQTCSCLHRLSPSSQSCGSPVTDLFQIRRQCSKYRRKFSYTLN